MNMTLNMIWKSIDGARRNVSISAIYAYVEQLLHSNCNTRSNE
jgi:hypothetical protein